MYSKRTGAGTLPLVFVHGFGCSHEDWEAQRKALEGRHEVIACDLPGHGRSPGSLKEARIANFGREVAGLLERPSVIIGHSMGCRVALQAAALQPDRVAGIVLVDGSCIGRGDPALAQEKVRKEIDAVGYPAFISAFFEAMFFRPLPQKDEVLARASRLPADFGRALFLDIVRWDAAELEGVLAQVRAPLLAIQSTTTNAERKRVTMRMGDTSPWLELLKECVPGTRVEIIPGIGHFVPLEAPEETSRLVGSFP
ncbi:MAG TPA: alpha/beta hydrolase [Nitrospira sp.]|nr:alpha/beta hydrolase [Nitrospira sp.]